MLEIITGITAGTVSGMGMGGGTVLILVLSIFLGIEQHTAQATNLIFFIPTSIASIIVSIKNKLIDWNIGISILISGVIGAIIGANISSKLEVQQLRKFFGIFLAIIAIYEFYSIIKEYKIKKNTNNKIE